MTCNLTILKYENTASVLETVLKPKVDNHSLFFASQKKHTVRKPIKKTASH